MGSPLVSGIGFTLIVSGNLVFGFISTSSLSLASVLTGLGLVGLGIEFTMGAPFNYLVLKNVPDHEATTAMATISPARSIGITMLLLRRSRSNPKVD